MKKISNNILIGRYIPGNSFFHKLDARTKILYIFLYILQIFISKTIIDYSILILILFASIMAARIKINHFIKGIRPILWIIIITFAIHILFTDGGEIIYQWNIIKIYSHGIEQAIYISLRIILLVGAATFLSLTTSPIDLATGLEKIFTPFKKLKVPVHEIALMMTISIRFIPIIFEETDKIFKAQIARGASINSGPFKERIISIISVIVPLFNNTFRRAEELANAMEARCYRGGMGRTRMNENVIDQKDYIFMSIVIIVFIIFIIM